MTPTLRTGLLCLIALVGCAAEAPETGPDVPAPTEDGTHDAEDDATETDADDVLAAGGVCEFAGTGSATAAEGRKKGKKRAKAAALAACEASGCSGDCLPDGAKCSDEADGSYACNACSYCESVLHEVNRARRTARNCGSASFAAAPPLVRSAGLQSYAYDWAVWMAANKRLVHSAATGAELRTKYQSYGVSAGAVGEAIAGGPVVPTPATVVQGWLDSPPHCEIVMSPLFTIAGAKGALTGTGGSYWSLNTGG